MCKSVTFSHPVPKLLVNKSQKKCSYRTLWCHSKVDLWPFESKKSSHFIRLDICVFKISTWNAELWPQCFCEITVTDYEIQKKFSQGFTEILNLRVVTTQGQLDLDAWPLTIKSLSDHPWARADVCPAFEEIPSMCSGDITLTRMGTMDNPTLALLLEAIVSRGKSSKSPDKSTFSASMRWPSRSGVF